jgi:hypothetical protein
MKKFILAALLVTVFAAPAFGAVKHHRHHYKHIHHHHHV